MQFDSSLDYLGAVSSGLISGASIVEVFGRNAAIPNGGWAFVGNVPDNNWRILTANTFNVKAGGDVNDTELGDGAREVALVGLGSGGQELTELLATKGSSASLSTPSSLCRVFRSYVSKTGTRNSSNTGPIILESGGAEIIHIGSGEGQSEFGGYTIPVGKKGFLIGVNINVAANKSADVRCFVYEGINNAVAPFNPQKLVLYFDELIGPHTAQSKTAIIEMPELTDIWFEGYGNGNMTAIDVNYEILLLDKKT